MTVVDDLLAGPRGRAMALWFAFRSEELSGAEPGRLWSAALRASAPLDPLRASARVYTRAGGVAERSPHHGSVSPEEVAEILASVTLADPTFEVVRGALESSVDEAAYWHRRPGWTCW